MNIPRVNSGAHWYKAHSRMVVRLATKARDRLGHRPGGDVSSACAEPWSLLVVVYAVVAASFSGQRNASPVISMRCRITANLRASATQAFLWLVRFLIRRAQSFSG